MTDLNTTPTTELTDKQKSLAAFNHPSDSEHEFELGGRKFKVLYLDYDSYLEYLSLLQPLFESIAGGIMGKQNVSLPGISLPKEGFSFPKILQYCAKDLPRLVVLTCNQQAIREGRLNEVVDVKWAKEHAGTPFALAKIVALQIAQNKFITEISDFFAQFLPLLKQASSLSVK